MTEKFDIKINNKIEIVVKTKPRKGSSAIQIENLDERLRHNFRISRTPSSKEDYIDLSISELFDLQELIEQFIKTYREA